MDDLASDQLAAQGKRQKIAPPPRSCPASDHTSRSVVSTKTPCCGTVIVTTPAASAATTCDGPTTPSPASFQTARRSFFAVGSPPIVYDTCVGDAVFSCAPAVSRPTRVRWPDLP